MEILKMEDALTGEILEYEVPELMTYAEFKAKYEISERFAILVNGKIADLDHQVDLDATHVLLAIVAGG